MHIDENAPFPRQNHLLASLPEAEYLNIEPLLELVSLPLDQTLYESGGRQQYVYFPITGIISILYVLGNGSTTEIAVIGNEGLLGLSVCLGGQTTPNRAIVQVAGESYRMLASALKREFDSNDRIMNLLLRYTQALITQMGQTAVCNRHHSIEQQLCRWLLLSVDRLPTNDVYMTQELIANMLGVRREGVTEAARKLQNAGLIKYSRGHIQVMDRPKLEKSVCECYQVVKNEFERLLPLKHDPKNSRQLENRTDLARSLN